MNKLWKLVLSLALIAAVLIAGALAEAEKPIIHAATYTNDGAAPRVTLEYTDPQNLDWIEVYLLKKGVVEPNMGTMDVDGETFSVVGIQTINPTDPEMYKVREDGVTELNTELYLGDCAPADPGDEVFLTVGLTGEDGEEALGELVPVTVPEAGETFAADLENKEE